MNYIMVIFITALKLQNIVWHKNKLTVNKSFEILSIIEINQKSW